MTYATSSERLILAWIIVFLLVVWSAAWKLVALWKAARRDQLGWYVVLALMPPVAGALEMVYIFFVAPRVPDLASPDNPF